MRKIYDNGFTNFYLTITSNKVKTLLYSGTFSFYTDLTFVDNDTTNISDTSTIQPPSSTTPTTATESSTSEWPKAGRTVIIYTKYKDTSVTSK